MGTSSARRAPSGRYWRRAKTALGRFATTGGATPKAAEVVAQYCAALALEPPETSQELLTALATTAANLSQFYYLWGAKGLPAALLGFDCPSPSNPGVLWLLLVERLAGVGSSLAQATARAALMAHLTATLDLEASSEQFLRCPPQPEKIPHLMVDYLARFLATSILVDLGEILEYRALQVQTARSCQKVLEEEILSRLPSLATEVLPVPLPAPPALFFKSCQTLIGLLARRARDE